MKPLIIILIIIAVLGFGGTGYFFTQTQSLENQIAVLQDAKSKAETELAVLKSTDLAKENELLRSKLKSAEDTLVSEKRAHENTQSKLTAVETKINALETTIKKAKPYINVLTAFNDWQFTASPFYLVDRDTSAIDNAISSLGDTQISNLWREIKTGFPAAKQTGNIRHEEVIILITSKLASLLK